MKLYIAGKITGDPDYREKFQRAAKDLEQQGYIVLNPATMPEGMEPADYMRICLAMIDTAEIVAFLPDWEESAGARLEYEYCTYTGKPTRKIETMAPYANIAKRDNLAWDIVNACVTCGADRSTNACSSCYTGNPPSQWRPKVTKNCLNCGQKNAVLCDDCHIGIMAGLSAVHWAPKEAKSASDNQIPRK